MEEWDGAIMASVGLFSDKFSHFFPGNHSSHIAHIYAVLFALSPFPYLIILMVNYNMGQYYAWSNLSKFIRNTYRKHFYTPRYNFTHIKPKVHTQFEFIPFENWKASKPRNTQTESAMRVSSSTR